MTNTNDLLHRILDISEASYLQAEATTSIRSKALAFATALDLIDETIREHLSGNSTEEPSASDENQAEEALDSEVTDFLSRIFVPEQMDATLADVFDRLDKTVKKFTKE